jgi:hypothetical protein
MTRPRVRCRAAVSAFAASLALAAWAPPAGAVTIGQTAPSPFNECSGVVVADFVQPTVNSGSAYVVPANGGIGSWTLTSWSTNATPDAGQKVSLKIFRKVSDVPEYQAISHEGPHDLHAGLNRFAVNVLVRPGDLLGSHFDGEAGACTFSAPGEAYDYGPGDLQDGAVGDFFPDSTHSLRVNISAEITPTSGFTLGKLKSKANGTAKLAVNVPNPGVLTASGGGAKASSPVAVAAKQVPSAGTVKLTIKAKGAKKRRLSRKGKVTVNPKITFTPTGGIPASEFRKVKLHRG